MPQLLNIGVRKKRKDSKSPRCSWRKQIKTDAFFGCVKRLKDDNCNQFVFSRILIPDGLLCASAPEQQELGENLDKLCKMVIDEGLHSDCDVTTEIFGTDFYLN